MLLLFHGFLNVTGQMFMNYFGNSGMLSIYQKFFKKAMVERIY